MKTGDCIKSFFVVAIFLPYASCLMAQEWTVPGDKKEQAAPFLFTAETVQKGADLFSKNCQSCHGIPAKASFATMDPSPGDPASEKFRKLTDGEMFYKISNGRGAMPQFRLILSEEERWDLVSFLRSFHPGYIQPELPVIQTAGGGKRGILELGFDSISNSVKVRVFVKRDDGEDPVPRAGVLFYVKRYFGSLPLGDQILTGPDGIIYYRFPEGIPGDSAGSVTLVARLNESAGYGGAKKEIRVPLGNPVKWVPLTTGRAMWNINAKAPVWLALAYSLTVTGVLITLIYIMLQIRKIFYLGTAARKELTANPDIDQNPQI